MGAWVTGQLSIAEIGFEWEFWTDWRGLSSLPQSWYRSGFRTENFNALGFRANTGGFGPARWEVDLLLGEGAPNLVKPPIVMFSHWRATATSSGFLAGRLFNGAGGPGANAYSQAVAGYNSSFGYYGYGNVGFGAFPADREAFVTNAGDPGTLEVWTAGLLYGLRRGAFAANEDGGYDDTVSGTASSFSSFAPTPLTVEVDFAPSGSYLVHTGISFGKHLTRAQIEQAWRDHMAYPG